MRLVLATNAFDHVGGSETYLLTAAEHLQRLGHELVIHAVEVGAVAELACTRGIPVAASEDELPAACDAAIVQDAGMAYALADRYPGTPQLFVAHSPLHDFQLPPQIAASPVSVVVMNERVAARVAALDLPYPVTRLRQPIDTERFVALGAPRERPRRVLLLGNYQESQHRDLLEQAWAPAGVEFVTTGRRDSAVVDPFEQIADADIIVGKGRVILEAMACGRPAYLYDDFGTDGWVTHENYEQLESSGFNGQATTRTADLGLLREDLAAYDPAMGIANRELVLLGHNARSHAQELAQLLIELAPGERTAPATATELARNVRLRWAADSEVGYLRSLFADLHRRLGEAEARAAAAAGQATETEQRLRAVDQRAIEAEQWGERASAQAQEAQERLAVLLAQRRVQIGIAAGRATDRIKRAVRR